MTTSSIDGVAVLNCRIPDDIHREARMEAFRQGISLKEFVIRALREKLDTAAK